MSQHASLPAHYDHVGSFLRPQYLLEAQQLAIDERPGYSFYNLNIDAGAMWARRLIDQMVARETPRAATIPIQPAALGQAR